MSKVANYGLIILTKKTQINNLYSLKYQKMEMSSELQHATLPHKFQKFTK